MMLNSKVTNSHLAKTPWIVLKQDPESLNKFIGPVVWVICCKRCNAEEPIHEGPLDVVLFHANRFLNLHNDCKEMRNDNGV